MYVLIVGHVSILFGIVLKFITIEMYLDVKHKNNELNFA